MLPHGPQAPPEPANIQKTSQQPDQTDLKNQRARLQARSLLDKQEYAAAVDFIRDAILKGAGEQALGEEYLEATNSSLAQADSLIKAADYAAAALLFKTVLDGYPQTPDLQQRVTLTRTQIADRLNSCAERLMEAGLVAYRAGEFDRSIDIWQQILVFDPQHQAALDAIETTRQQLSRLKSLKDKE